jgi:DNA-binding NarL/FixJ family response regulator
VIRVFVADDHPVVCEGLKRIIADDDALEFAGEASSCGEAYRKVLDAKVDVLLLDLEMPGRGGIDTLKELKEQRPDLPVLILSHYPEDPYAIRAIRAGAAGYLRKGSIPDKLVAAIKQVARGKKYLTEEVAEQLAMLLGGEIQEKPHESLSDREFQVLCRIGEGKTVSEIAEDFSLSVKTISTYRSRILEKMGIKNNAQLMRYVLDNDLL